MVAESSYLLTSETWTELLLALNAEVKKSFQELQTDV